MTVQGSGVLIVARTKLTKYKFRLSITFVIKSVISLIHSVHSDIWIKVKQERSEFVLRSREKKNDNRE